MDTNAASSFSLPPARVNVTWVTRNVGVSLHRGNANIGVICPKNLDIKGAIVAVISRYGLLVKSDRMSTNIEKDIHTFLVHDAREDLWEAIPLNEKCKLAAQEIERNLLG